MRFINTKDIEIWADSIDCKYHLPHLIRKLVLATININSIKNIHFPYGEDIQTGGYDGELVTEAENMFVPLGESVWEFGTTNRKKGKADEDFEKRSLNPMEKNPSQTTYINVNAKKYRDKKKWEEEKRSEGFWKDVKYLDAIDIEQWLELTPTVELWLAEKLNKPILGIYTADEYWKRWSENKSIKIVPEILLGDSRLKEIEILNNFLVNENNTLYIKSITTDEALAFSLAVIKQAKDVVETNIVVIDDRNAFNHFTQTNEPLTIVVKFKAENTDLTGAIHRGHKLIIPISLSEEINANKIQLPIIARNSFEEGLKDMGIDPEQTRLLTTNSGRNISVLKRLLQFDNNTKPRYIEEIKVEDIIPILLINRFSEKYEGDKKIVEKLSGKPFSEYIRFLKKLCAVEDTPVYYINGIWRLISPTDTWLYFAKYITKEDFEKFQELCVEITSEIHHKYTLPIDARGNYYETPENRSTYSWSLKEGISESLVVIAVFGSDYGINSIPNPTAYVDRTVQQILENDVVVWRSLSNNLMLLAEASPTVFINSLDRIINDNSVTAFFEVEKGFMNNSNDLAPLLWCLDIISWMPEHLMKVSFILCELILASPESFPTTNTPMASLRSIYRIWYPQTNTNAEDRKRILELLIKKYPKIGYDLLYGLIDNKYDTAFHTPRPKWRLFSELRAIKVTNQEVHFMADFSMDKIIELSRGNITRILFLIKLLGDMSWNKIDSALKMIQGCTEFDKKNKSDIYHSFRKLIGHHSSYPTAHWALPNSILDKMRNNAIIFKPKDNLLNDKYLFEEHHPEFIEGRESDDYEKQAEKILSKRVDFVEKISSEYGVDKIFELANEVEHPHLYGNALANSTKINDEDNFAIYKLIDSENPKHVSLANNFILLSENRTSLKEQSIVLDRLIQSGISVRGIVNFLNSLRSNINLWKYISSLKNEEVEALYWKSRQRFLYTHSKTELFYALEKLKRYNKAITLLNTLGWGIYSHKKHITSEEILTFLEDISFTDIEDSSKFDLSQFKNTFDFLHSKEDYEIERGAKIELKFLFVFAGDSYSPTPQNLYKLMAKRPEEYFGVVSQVYLPDDEELKEAELQKMKENPGYLQIYKAIRKTLDDFNMIPSLQEDGTLNPIELKKWVADVRKLAEENHRVEVTDNCIGKLLAKYPIDMKETKGFPTEIYEIVEEVGTNEIKNAFEIQITNNLGFTSRGAFDGGDIERFRSKYFNSLFEETKFIYPNVSMIFKKLRDNYLREATWEDETALLRSLE